jgi:ABC-2 type transport system permease protein
MRHAAGVHLRSLGAHFKTLPEYPGDFWVMAGAGVFWQVVQFAFISVLFANVDAVGGWDYHEMLMLAGFLAMTRASNALFWDGVWSTAQLVITGGMDYFMCRPAPVLVQVGGLHIGMQGFGNAALGLVMVVTGGIGAGLSLWAVPVGLVLLVCSCAVQMSILTAVNAVAFWVKGPTSVLGLMIIELQAAVMRFPMPIYHIAVQAALVFLLPLAFTAFVPAAVLSGHLSPWWLAAAVAAASTTVPLAALTYRAGLNAYESAGSLIP